MSLSWHDKLRTNMPGRLAFVLPLLLGSALAAGRQNPAMSRGDIWVELRQNAPALRVAIPDLVPVTPLERHAAEQISRIVFDDISFATVFRIVPAEKYALAGKIEPNIDYYGWESIGADVVVAGRVAARNGEIHADVRIHDVRTKRVAFSTVYIGHDGFTRHLAHHISDRILDRFGLVGIARTQIAFASTRGSKTGNKSIWIADYDGAAARPLTRNHHLDLQPRWLPDGSGLSFLSYPKQDAPPVLALLGGSPIVQGPGMVFSASWSPDGTRLAFSSTRDEAGNAEIYVMGRDGSGLRRLTHHPGIDVSPTWSPTGREIAFTSERNGSPQVYVMDAEGLNLRRISLKGSYNAEPSWSPSKEISEIAYASRLEGGRFDIVVHDLTTRQVRQLTSQSGSNESPSWSPNGRHLVFTSTRTGESQIYTMNRDGSNPRPLTSEGSSATPSWGPLIRGTRPGRATSDLLLRR